MSFPIIEEHGDIVITPAQVGDWKINFEASNADEELVLLDFNNSSIQTVNSVDIQTVNSVETQAVNSVEVQAVNSVDVQDVNSVNNIINDSMEITNQIIPETQLSDLTQSIDEAISNKTEIGKRIYLQL